MASLFCNLCFSSDHNQNVCPLVAPVLLDEEEEDPEELIFEEGSSDDEPAQAVGGAGVAAAPVAAVAAALDANDVAAGIQAEDADYIPLEEAGDFILAPRIHHDVPDAEDLEEPVRPGYVDVYMPYVHMAMYDNLAYAFINPPLPSPENFIYQVADLGCGPDRVSLLSSYLGARLVVFSLPLDREFAVDNGPYLGREATVYFERHDESENRFVFEHEALAALSIEDFAIEHWYREHIVHSSAPYANPHTIDPICLIGLDYSAVLVTVKAETLTDIPRNLCVKNHRSDGAIGKVTIIDFEDLAPGSDPSDHDFEPIPDALSSDDKHDGVLIEGGTDYASVMNALGIPAPQVPHGARSAAAPAASLASIAIANAPPLPLVLGEPLRSKPKKIFYRLHLGLFDVFVFGLVGERAFYRLPMRPLPSDPSPKGLMVVNLSSASVGLINSIDRVGPLRRPTLVDILAQGLPPSPEVQVSVDLATKLLLGNTSPTTNLEAAAPVLNAVAPCAALAPTNAARILDEQPMHTAIWPSPSPTSARPRRSSRFAKKEEKMYISIVDKAVRRKKEIMEGSSSSAPCRSGELAVADLMAVIVDEAAPWPFKIFMRLGRLAISLLLIWTWSLQSLRCRLGPHDWTGSLRPAHLGSLGRHPPLLCDQPELSYVSFYQSAASCLWADPLLALCLEPVSSQGLRCFLPVCLS
uniref:Uncharacterized protein n=1 Tax=Avena sativa TaxID=4498 RepID=A0ACD5UUT9_AVESA